VPKVENFYHMPVFANLVIDQNRTCATISAHATVFGSFLPCAGNHSKDQTWSGKDLPKTRGSLIIIFGNVPDDFQLDRLSLLRVRRGGNPLGQQLANFLGRNTSARF